MQRCRTPTPAQKMQCMHAIDKQRNTTRKGKKVMKGSWLIVLSIARNDLEEKFGLGEDKIGISNEI